jgi:hypothetical protein
MKRGLGPLHIVVFLDNDFLGVFLAKFNDGF